MIEAERESTSEQQSSIREAEFTETTLTVTAVDDTVSYAEPMEIEGQLEGADGETFGETDLTFNQSKQSTTVETDEDGVFTLTYTPTATTPLDTETTTITFEPDATSTYLSSADTVAIDIQQVDATIADLESTDTVAFNETFEVNASVSAENSPVDRVNATVSAGGEPLDTLSVKDGELNGTVRMTENVSSGPQQLAVQLSLGETAVGTANATTPLTVSATTTEIDLTVPQNEAESVNRDVDELGYEIDGALTTVDGVGLGHQPIEVYIDETPVKTIETAENGSISGTLSKTDLEGAHENDEVEVVASFDGSGTNLESTETATTVKISGAETSLPTHLLTNPWLIGGVGGFIFVGFGFWWWQRETDPDSNTKTELPDPSPVKHGREDHTAQQATEQAQITTLLEEADSRLSRADVEGAIRATYAAARRVGGQQIDTDRTLTHWEFFNQFESQAGDDETDALRHVTEAYERATYTPNTLDADDAQAARSLVSRLHDGGGGSGATQPTRSSGDD